MPDITDDEYEKLIRNLYIVHKRKLYEEKLSYVLFGVVIILVISFTGAFISMIIKITQ